MVTKTAVPERFCKLLNAAKATEFNGMCRTPPFLLREMITNRRGNAERLVGRHGKNFRYLHDSKLWLYWDGRRWNPDQTAEVYRAAKEMIRAMHWITATLDDDMRIKFAKWVTQSESRGSRENMVALAQKEERFSALSSEFDTDAAQCPERHD
jgi:phage/plasmid-associated DNA primase